MINTMRQLAWEIIAEEEIDASSAAGVTAALLTDPQKTIMVVSAEGGADIRFSFTETPTATVGFILPAGGSMIVTGPNDIRRIRFFGGTVRVGLGRQ